LADCFFLVLVLVSAGVGNISATWLKKNHNMFLNSLANSDLLRKMIKNTTKVVFFLLLTG